MCLRLAVLIVGVVVAVAVAVVLLRRDLMPGTLHE